MTLDPSQTLCWNSLKVGVPQARPVIGETVLFLPIDRNLVPLVTSFNVLRVSEIFHYSWLNLCTEVCFFSPLFRNISKRKKNTSQGERKEKSIKIYIYLYNIYYNIYINIPLLRKKLGKKNKIIIFI